jgi:glycosyltransferase involved in cell wall biosynthesis
MEKKVITDVIIPAFNEENSVGKVIDDIPRKIVRNIIVVNNASTDETERVAREKGAIVLREPVSGYGRACLKGIDHLAKLAATPDLVVFLDADYSDHPEEMSELLGPVMSRDFDLVIGSRARGERQKGSMTPQQIFGNWLATTLIKLLYGVNFTDLGPFRVIKYRKLLELDMRDKNYGWTVEMQVKAAKQNLKCTEVPVTYRKRIGKSKVSGTVKGTIMAGYKILLTIFRNL